MSLATLGHACEEGRHAFLLKKLALKTGGPSFDDYSPEHLLCGKEAETYFQALDEGCMHHLKQHMKEFDASLLTYYYVTWLVEVRALEVYGAYVEALQRMGQTSPLVGLIAEEDKHLAYVEEALLKRDPGFKSRQPLFKELETELYNYYLRALNAELSFKQREIHA